MSGVPERSRMVPPLPLLVGLVLGLGCGLVWPWPIGPHAVVLTCGILLLGLVGVAVWWLLHAFRRHDTSADPKDEVTAIVDTGPFRYSRNPAYISAAMLQVAVGLLFNTAWVLLTTIPAMIVIQFVVVLKEEAYLEHEFGDAYLEYKSRVRRWI